MAYSKSSAAAKAFVLVGLAMVLSGPFFSAHADLLRDTAITARVETAFMLNEHLSASSIITSTQNGIVTLNGSVRTEAAKALAGDIASTAKNVDGVDNRLIVMPESRVEEAHERDWRDTVNDMTVTASVRTNLLYHRRFAGFKLGITTKGGRVTVSGNVPTQPDIAAIVEIVSTTKGVRSVQNNLKTGEPGKVETFFRETGETIGAETAEQRVRSRLWFNRDMDGAEVEIFVKDGLCSLKGTVAVEEQRALAENIAGTVPGVTSVKNSLTVRVAEPVAAAEGVELLEPEIEERAE